MIYLISLVLVLLSLEVILCENEIPYFPLQITSSLKITANLIDKDSGNTSS